MSELIYQTKEWKGYGKQEYYSYKYLREGDIVTKYKCRRAKFFDGKENNWEKEERVEQSWSVDDTSMPEWLMERIQKMEVEKEKKEQSTIMKAENGIAKVFAFIRRLLLMVFLLVLLYVCITRLDYKTELGTVIYAVLLGVGGLYAVISIICAVIRGIRRDKLSARGAEIMSLSGVLTVRANSKVINFFRRIAVWGTLMLLVNIFVYNLKWSDFISGSYAADWFMNVYYGFLLWSLISVVVLAIISVGFWGVYLPHSGEKTYNIGQYLLRLYLADLATPFRTVKNVISMRKEGPRFEYIFNFIIMMLFIIGNIIVFWEIVHI